MKNLCICAALMLSQLLFGAVKVSVKADRDSYHYKSGEKVTFTVTAKDDGKALAGSKITLKLTYDGKTIIKNETATLDKNGQATISGTLDKPGFLRLNASLIHNKKRVGAVIGAGFDVEKIVPAVPAPADFDKFWKDALKKEAAVKADFKMEKLDKFSTAISTAYKVSVAAPGGGRIYGTLRIPKSGKPVPMMVTVPGAGPNYSSIPAEGKIAGLYANVHKYDPLDPAKSTKQHYIEIAAKGHYMHKSYENLENNQMYNSIIGINRLIECVAALPEINKNKLIYSGSSQGGGFGIILAGLVPGRFKAVVSNVTALCDLNGFRAGRNSGWPNVDEKTPMSELSRKNMLYFDAANFARRIKNADVTVIMGYADTTCAPSSTRAMYNNIPGSRKKLVTIPSMGHQVWGDYSRAVNKIKADIIK